MQSLKKLSQEEKKHKIYIYSIIVFSKLSEEPFHLCNNQKLQK